jgi:Ser/Thr protein kinase RdoA (MazF antagonist)
MNESACQADLPADDPETNGTLSRQLAFFHDLARSALVNWGFGAGCELSLIKHRENAVYKLVTASGETFALRVHRAGYHSGDALRSELQWMTELNASGLSTPQSIRTLSGDWFVEQRGVHDATEYQIDILSWVDGEPLGSVEAGLDGDVSQLASNYRQVGAMAARLHRLSASWEKPGGFTRQAWDVKGCFSEDALWGRFQDLAVLTLAQKATLEAARESLVELLTQLAKSAEVYGLIHCDLVPENLLGTDQEIYLIDFDDSGYGWYLFEVATSLFFLLGEPYFEEVCQAFIDGYRSERPLSDEHLELLPAFFLLRALVYLGWAHTRRETDTAREMTPMIVAAALEMAEAFLLETTK